jgi:hypothetical protein
MIKLKYTIFHIHESEVCTPSEDYYRSKNDWNSGNTMMMTPVSKHDSMKEAEDELVLNENLCGDYTILPIWSK